MLGLSRVCTWACQYSIISFSLSLEVIIGTSIGVCGINFKSLTIGILMKSMLFWTVVLIVICSFVEKVINNEVKLSRMTGGHLFNKHNTGSERVACGASGQIKTGAKGVEDRVGEKPTNITPQPTVLALFPAA